MPQSLIAALKGMMVSLLLMLIFLLLSSAILIFSSLSEQFMYRIVPLIRFLCIFSGAFLAAKTIGHKGIWLGMLISFSFLGLFFVLFSCLHLNKALLLAVSWELILAGIIGGGAGVISFKN